MSEEIGGVLDTYVREAQQLRAVVDLPVVGTTAAEVLVFLAEVRSRLDRIEELLMRSIRLRAKAMRTHAIAQAAFDDAFDASITQIRRAPSSPGREFLSARERTAEANLAVIDLRGTARGAQSIVAHCDEAVDCIRLAYRGMDGLRQDAHAVLRAFTFESHLER